MMLYYIPNLIPNPKPHDSSFATLLIMLPRYPTASLFTTQLAQLLHYPLPQLPHYPTASLITTQLPQLPHHPLYSTAPIIKLPEDGNWGGAGGAAGCMVLQLPHAPGSAWLVKPTARGEVLLMQVRLASLFARKRGFSCSVREGSVEYLCVPLSKCLLLLSICTCKCCCSIFSDMRKKFGIV